MVLEGVHRRSGELQAALVDESRSGFCGDFSGLGSGQKLSISPGSTRTVSFCVSRLSCLALSLLLVVSSSVPSLHLVETELLVRLLSLDVRARCF
jgi:hypothetical protein